MSQLVIRAARPSAVSGGGEPVDLYLDDYGVHAVAPAGSDAALEGWGSAREIHADGRCVLPGLWDEHVHTGQWAMTAKRLDLVHADTAAAAVAAVKTGLAERLKAEPSNRDVFVGARLREASWPDPVRLSELDAATGDIPVVLVCIDLHSCWLNTAALTRYGVTEHREGLIAEHEAYRVEAEIASIPDATLDDWVHESLQHAASIGTVGVVDLEMRDNVGAWQRRSAAQPVPLRVEACAYLDQLDAAIAAGLRTGDVIEPSSRVRFGYFKVITDGSLNTRTAWCRHAYPDGGHGAANYDFAELETAVRRALEANITPTLHAIGDRANHEVLNLFARTLPGRDLALAQRPRIEHVQQVELADLPRFAELGVTASIQPEHAMDDRDIAEKIWPGRLDGAYLVRSLFDAGANVAFGSDAPVAPLNPWDQIASAVFRSRDGRAPWRPEERISFAQALAASTRGRIAVRPGDPADLILLDADPATLGEAELRRAPVSATVVAAEVSFGG